jgi:hypothetical protein
MLVSLCSATVLYEAMYALCLAWIIQTRSSSPYKVFGCTFDVLLWAAVKQLVEALRYKQEGCGFDSGWCQWNFSWA